MIDRCPKCDKYMFFWQRKRNIDVIDYGVSITVIQGHKKCVRREDQSDLAKFFEMNGA